jgi:aminoglycoside phosphotransferase (APT) family kinase protein
VHTRSGAQIRVDGDVVVKLHRAGTDPVALRGRLDVAVRLGALPDGVLVPPLSAQPELGNDAAARWQSRWPRVEVLPPDPDSAPWGEAGRVLARLHRAAVRDVDTRLQPGWPARLRRALASIRGQGTEQADVIECAAGGLPPQAWQAGDQARPATLVHGDWHLGQLGRMSGEACWRLIDVDDLGVGDPVWDLARPAGFWAADILPDADWDAFVRGYRDAGGPALPPAPTNPWPVLDVVARAAVIQAAAMGASAGSAEDLEGQAALVAACARMPHQLEKNSRPNPCLR